MKKHKLLFTLVATLTAQVLFGQSSEIVRKYIETYKDIAIAEEIRTGVPAAITLAQGIHETGAGTSDLVLASNNHFGIKCKSDWTGESVSHDDDAKGECFRKYESPLDSYRDHSDFLKNRPYYTALFKLDPTDYKAWAYGLKKAGYATNPRYPQILIKLVEDYDLQQYTLIALNSKSPVQQDAIYASSKETNENSREVPAVSNAVVKKPDYPSGVFRINQTKVVFIEKGTSFLKVADENGISLARLFEFNDMMPADVAVENQLIYLQRKRKVGADDFHMVQEGESLHDIAQQEGVRIESLMEYNFLTLNARPAAGEKLYLKHKAPQMPKLVAAR